MAHRQPSSGPGVGLFWAELHRNHLKRKRQMPSHFLGCGFASVVAIIEKKNYGVRRFRLCRQGSYAGLDSINLVPHRDRDDDLTHEE
jgi:hypothetical protein